MDKIDNTLTQFYYNQKIIINKGFNRGQIGIIKGYEISKDETEIYDVEIESKDTNKKIIVKVNGNFLKKYSFLPF